MMLFMMVTTISCKKKKNCEECQSKIYEYEVQIEEIKAYHANNHCCGFHSSAQGYNTTLSQSEVNDITLIEQNIYMCERQMYNDCKKQFKVHDYEFYKQ